MELKTKERSAAPQATKHRTTRTGRSPASASFPMMALFAVLTVSACGGGDDDESAAAAPNAQLPSSPAPDAVARTGYLLNIKGVRYNACGYQGTTGDRGAFTYDSKPVRCPAAFFLGNMQLGQRIDVTDIPIVTPYDLFPADVVGGENLLTFMQSLNARPNARGVIEIPATVEQVARDASWSIDFDAENFATAASQALTSTGGGAQLVETSSAIANYAPSTRCLHTGHVVGNWGGYESTRTINAITGATSTTYAGAIGGGAEGVLTPDGQTWMNLNEDPDARDGPGLSNTSALYLPFSVLSGPLPMETILPNGEITLSLNYSGSYRVEGPLKKAGNDKWSGRIRAGSVNRSATWVFGAGADWTRFYFDVPEMRFAGRSGTAVFGMDVYADKTVRAVVADTQGETKYKAYGLGRSLMKARLDTDGHVFGSGIVDDPIEKQNYVIDGTVDRSSMTFVGKARFTSASAAGEIEVTAAGCLQFPVIE